MSDGMEENTAWLREVDHIGHTVRNFSDWLAEHDANAAADLRRKVEALPHAPACPGGKHCWCPIHQVLEMLNRGSDG